MCDPVSAAIVIGSTLVVGGGVQAFSQIKAGEAANAAGIRDRNNANRNADAMEGQANDALDRGGYEVDQLRAESSRRIGEGRAGLAAGNVDLSSGSAAYWELDASSTQQSDVERAKYAARQEAYGFRVQARNERARGINSRFSGKHGLHQGYTGSTATVLSSAGQAGASAYMIGKGG